MHRGGKNSGVKREQHIVAEPAKFLFSPISRMKFNLTIQIRDDAE